jgi:hypothetical protein
MCTDRGIADPKGRGLRQPATEKSVGYDRYIFVTVDWLTEFAGVDAAEQESWRVLTNDRVRSPAEKART